MPAQTLNVRLPRVWPAIVVAGAFAAIGGACVSMQDSLGYDESMHALLPAARMLLALQLGEGASAADALLACQQYPFVYPLLLALVQAFTGLSELACRVTGRVCWALALLGIFLVAREVAAGIARERVRRAPAQAADGATRWTPWIAMGLAAASPLGMGFSGTLFLEVPFTAVALFATWAWLRCARASEQPIPRRDFAAGALIALAFFTKFNYGGMLALGFALDFLLEGLSAFRGKSLAPWWRRAARLGCVPVLACAWWFVLPLPGGFTLGAQHREAFLGFLAGNRELVPASFARRALDWCAGVFVAPGLALACMVLALCALRFWRARELRTLLILGLACALPVAMHPFHLERLLLPAAPFLWVLAALGVGALPRSRWRGLGASAAFLITLAILGASLKLERMVAWAYPGPEPSPQVLEYREREMARKRSLAFDRALPTAGLPRAESDALLDAYATQAGPGARVGWLGAPEKMAPCALQLGLLARGGTRERFLANANDAMMFGVQGSDPNWDAARLAAWAGAFDVIFCSEPPDLGGKPAWNFLAQYRERLCNEHGFSAVEFAQVALQRPLRAPEQVRLIALRRSR